jgi:hypothetical protein
MKTAVNSPNLARFGRSAEHSSFDFVQAVCGLAGLAAVRYRFLCVQRFIFTQIPLFPRLRSGHRLFQRPSPQKQTLSNLGHSFGVVFSFPTEITRGPNDKLEKFKCLIGS